MTEYRIHVHDTELIYIIVIRNIYVYINMYINTYRSTKYINFIFNNDLGKTITYAYLLMSINRAHYVIRLHKLL